jgi:hypothetical protein
MTTMTPQVPPELIAREVRDHQKLIADARSAFSGKDEILFMFFPMLSIALIYAVTTYLTPHSRLDTMLLPFVMLIMGVQLREIRRIHRRIDALVQLLLDKR